MQAGSTLAVFLIALTAFSQTNTNPQGQYDLATTYDGSVLYFTSVPPGTQSSKIYRWSLTAGLTLFGDRPDLTKLRPYYGEHLYGTELTYSGAVLYHAEQLCPAPTGGNEPNNCGIGQTQVVDPNVPPFALTGYLLVSPNGRYGVAESVAVPYGGSALWMDWLTGQQIEVNLKNQFLPNVGPPYAVNQHAVANNGSFLITAPGGAGLVVWSPSGQIVLPQVNDRSIQITPGGSSAGPSISADGSTVAFGTFVYNVAAFAANPAASPVGFPQPVSLSDDGRTVAYLSAYGGEPYHGVQAIVANSDGTGARQITNLPYGINSVLLSGDGHCLYVVAFASDSGNPGTQIHRYVLSTGVHPKRRISLPYKRVDIIPLIP
jgi:hypothetical protein